MNPIIEQKDNDLYFSLPFLNGKAWICTTRPQRNGSVRVHVNTYGRIMFGGSYCHFRPETFGYKVVHERGYDETSYIVCSTAGEAKTVVTDLLSRATPIVQSVENEFNERSRKRKEQESSMKNAADELLSAFSNQQG
jgi:hypothetical protein